MVKFYSLKNILAKGAQYNMIFGERSNGKTYAALKYGIETYVATGKQTALIRRWREDFIGKRGQAMFESLTSNGEIAKLTDGKWTDVYYYASKWHLARWEDGERVYDQRPFCYGFSLSSMEHDKSTSYPDITTIVFDEFLSRTAYIPDEFVLFMNVVSTIVRHRHDVTILMLGNTVSKYCPYFNEMGLRHVKEMKQGTIDVYTYGDSPLKVAVEYTKPTKKGKSSDIYFAFDNPKLHMITGGVWEMDIYPHCPYKYRPKDVIMQYFIQFDGETLHCEIVSVDDITFTFIHRKTSPIKDTDTDIIYTQEHSPRPNYRRLITKPREKWEKKIAWYYATEKVFYADNEVGEIVRNYLMWCKKLG